MMQKTPNGNIDFEKELGITSQMTENGAAVNITSIETDPMKMRMNSVTDNLIRPRLIASDTKEQMRPGSARRQIEKTKTADVKILQAMTKEHQNNMPANNSNENPPSS